jgi:hypothetical protein
MLPMSDQAILQQNKLRRLREEMMEVSMSRKHVWISLKTSFFRDDDRFIRSMTQQN